jgi:hypothetical protein
MFAMVAAGLWFRARGYLFATEPFWQDEAAWAVNLLEEPLFDLLIRPLGFMGVTKALVKILSPSETVFRFLPWTAGVAAVLLAPPLAKRLFESAAARLLFVGILAFDPAAIDMGKEFKPYSVSLAIHAGLLFTALRYRDTRKGRDLVWVLLLAVPAVLFAQDALFAYPGLFLVLAIDAIIGKKWRHVPAIVGAAVVAIGIIGAHYEYVWSKIDQSKEERYWGRKYDVFYVPPKEGKGDQVGWLSSRYADATEAPGIRNDHWTSPHFKERSIERWRGVDDLAWLVLHVAGLTVIVRGRKFREGLLLFGPLAVIFAFNVLGRWPLGPFRTNLFALVYFSAIAAMAVDRTPARVRWADLLPVLLLVFLPLAAFERYWHQKKGSSNMTNTSYFPEALRTMVKLQASGYRGAKEPLVVDVTGCSVWKYYTKYNPVVSKELTPLLNRRFEYRCSSLLRSVLRDVHHRLRDHDRVWLIASNPHVVEGINEQWPENLRRAEVVRFGRDTQVVLAIEKARPIEQPEEPAADVTPEVE